MMTTDTGASPVAPPALELRSITKSFPSVRALSDVSLEVRAGEVLALVGENGAGKSTLLRILSGDHRPDSGELYDAGQPLVFGSPRDAQRAGVRVIYQEPEIAPGISVAENIYLGELPRRFGRFVDWSALSRQTRALLADFGLENALDPLVLAETLGPAQRQLVEILKALKSGARVLALDEPTSSLTDEEVKSLFAAVRRLRGQGLAIIYVSHRIREILELADRVAVLRDGRLVTVRPARDVSQEDIMRLMVGRPPSAIFGRQSHARAEVALRVETLRTSWLRDVSFEVRRGEVVGIAGLIGAGRTEVAKTLFGCRAIQGGRIVVNGRAFAPRGPRDALRAGICYLSEDRKGEGLVLTQSVRENVSLGILARLTRLRFIRRRAERGLVSRLTTSLSVKTPSIDHGVNTLSGGNQQKVALARWLAHEPRVLILDEPTRGIDVGAKAEIYRLIDRLASDGMAIIFISSELPEVIGVSDRILAMQGGRITGELAAAQASEEAILGLAMADHVSTPRAVVGARP